MPALDLSLGHRMVRRAPACSMFWPSRHFARSAAMQGAVAGEKPWPVDDLCPVEPLSRFFLSATTGSLTAFSNPTKMFSTIAESAWNTLIGMPWKIISIGTGDWAYRS